VPAKALRGIDAPGVVRLIGGRWKRTPLPVANMPGLRPTPSRVRQTLFDWLGTWWLRTSGRDGLDGCRVVDVFAGTGALGLEAASRGASSVRLVESDRRSAQALANLLVRLKVDPASVQVRSGDGVASLRALPAASVDLILLDPPFDADLHVPALAAARRALAVDGRAYLEAGRAFDDAELAALGFVCERRLTAGAVHAHLLALAPTLPAAPCGAGRSPGDLP
jgi:16S rRNA (guanine966-N2)-methyltransferase